MLLTSYDFWCAVECTYDHGHDEDGGQVVKEGFVVQRIGSLQNDPVKKETDSRVPCGGLLIRLTVAAGDRRTSLA